MGKQLGKAGKILICVALAIFIMASKISASAMALPEQDSETSETLNITGTDSKEMEPPSDGKVTKGFARGWIIVVVIGAAIVAYINTKDEKDT